MKRILIHKNYIRAAAIMAIFAVLIVYLPGRDLTDNTFESFFTMPVNEVSVEHEVFKDNFDVHQLNGVRVVNRETGKFTYYFEYIANKQDTLRRVAALPFLLKDNRPSSLACELMTVDGNPLDDSKLAPAEKEASAFFWNASAEEFTFYECYKSPVKHTLLLSKNSDRILHKVELI